MPPLHRALLVLGVISLTLLGCAPTANVSLSPIDVTENPGRRLDIVVQVDALDGARNLGRSDVTGTVMALWSDSERFRGWFTLVERIREPRDTVVMAVSVHLTSRTTQVTEKDDWTLTFLFGVPPNLQSHRVETTAAVTLVDAATGTVLASGSFTHAATHLSIGDADTERAGLRVALKEATQTALRAYAGG